MRWTTRACIIWLLWNLNEDAQLVILSVGEDDEGEYLDVVEDDEVLMEVSKLFEQRLSEDYDIE